MRSLSKKSIVIFVFLFGINAFSQYPVTIKNVRYLSDYPDGTDITSVLTNTIAISNDGDVIILPQGKFKITGQIAITGKDVSIIGQGADSITGTMLYKTSVTAGNWFFTYVNPNTDFTSFYFISGIYFKSVNHSSVSNNGVQFDRSGNWIFTDNTIQYINTWNVFTSHLDSITGFHGLMFNNRILDSYMTEIGNYGYGSGGSAAFNEQKKWITDPEFGSSKFIFIEDNYFYKTRHAVASTSNGKYVFRYNTVRDNWKTAAVDMHGTASYLGNKYSTRAAEIYNNDIETTIDSYGEMITEYTNPTHYTAGIGLRGGEALVYNNKVENYKYYLELYVEESSPTTYPYSYQIGYLSGVKYGSGDVGYDTDHGDGDVFFWNPIYIEKYPASGWDTLNIRQPTYIKVSRDVHNVQKPGYKAYPYPHPYRNYYYTFIDNFISKVNTPSASNIQLNSITLNWNDVIGEDGYYIYMSTDGHSYTRIDSTGLNITSKTLGYLNEGTTYYFYIRAFNDSHEGKESGILTSSTLKSSIPLPVFQSSLIENASPDKLEIIFDLDLVNIVPAVSAFTVMVNSLVRSVNSVSVSGTNVILTLASPVVYGDKVTVSYTKPASNPLQTAAGGQAGSFSAQNVLNNVEPASPLYLNSVIENATPDKLEMSYNLALTNIIPDVSAFTVRVNAVIRPVNSVTISGTKVLLTLGSPVVYGNSVTVSYNKPASNPLQTADGGQAASLSAQNVTNMVGAVSPVYINSVIEDATSDKLEMTYDLTLADIVPAASAFTVSVNSVNRPVNSVSVSGSKVILTLASPVVYGDKVTVSYSRPAINPLQTVEGGQAASVNAQNVTNNVKQSPVYISSVIENATPANLEMTYNIPLANIIPAASAFIISVNSSYRNVNSVNISDTKVSLTLASPVVYGDIITVAYNKPAANPLQTTSGKQAVSFTAQSVINNCIPVSNKNPVISISSPDNNSSFIPLATLFIQAYAYDPDGAIRKVEFLNGTIKLVEITTDVNSNVYYYDYMWKDVTEGTYTLTAIATDNFDARTVSDAVSVTVATNQLPVISISSPGNDTVFEIPAIITITASATDNDGTISKVEFYNRDIKIGESFTFPYRISYECADAGTYEITALATDNLNAVASSSPVILYAASYNENPDSIYIYPNPNNGRFSIFLSPSLPKEIYFINIVNITGETVYTGRLTEEENIRQFDLFHLVAGTYILIITSGSNIITTKKIIKN